MFLIVKKNFIWSNFSYQLFFKYLLKISEQRNIHCFADSAKFRPLASRESLWRKNMRPRRCDRRRLCRSGNRQKLRRPGF